LGLDEDPGTTAKALVGLANNRGGRDNSTVLIVDVQVEVIDSDNANQSPGLEEVQNPVSALPKETNSSPSDSEKPSKSSKQLLNAKKGSWLFHQIHIKVGAIIVSLALLLASATMIATISWYARSSYHVSLVANHVVIQKGRIGGLLWFKPTLEHWTDIQTIHLTKEDQERLAAGEPMSDLRDAKTFVANLRIRLVKGVDGS